MATGKIIKLSPKGFGFITSIELPYTRIFFHWSALLQSTKKFTELKIGDKVEFESKDVDGKGMRAIKISVVN